VPCNIQLNSAAGEGGELDPLPRSNTDMEQQFLPQDHLFFAGDDEDSNGPECHKSFTKGILPYAAMGTPAEVSSSSEGWPNAHQNR